MTYASKQEILVSVCKVQNYIIHAHCAFMKMPYFGVELSPLSTQGSVYVWKAVHIPQLEISTTKISKFYLNL